VGTAIVVTGLRLLVIAVRACSRGCMGSDDVTAADVAKAPMPYTAHPVQVESPRGVFNRALATNCKVRAVTDTVHTQSGRTLAYAQTGQPDGVPLFYFHGIPGSRLDFEQPFNRPALEDTGCGSSG
jgi:hypothetical protein